MSDKQASPSPVAASSPPPSSSSGAASSPYAEDLLETPWTFYFDKKLSRETLAAQPANSLTTYAHNLQNMGTFSSIQGFWKHYAFIQPPDDIPRDHNIYMFRNNLLPAWETFPQGGCWIIKVRKHNGVINRLWEELCFACIGEWFEDPDVVGITLATRTKDDNISVWNRGPDMKVKIGEKLKEILNLDESTTVEYKPFKSAMQDGSSFRNAKQFMYTAAPTY